MRKGIKVRRVVRRFELWSVFKIGLVFHACCYLVTVGMAVVLWGIASRLGTVDRLETFFVDLGWEKFDLDGAVLFRSLATGGVLLAAVNVIGTVLMAFFYNCVSGIIGGLVVSVLEEAPSGERTVAMRTVGRPAAGPAMVRPGGVPRVAPEDSATRRRRSVKRRKGPGALGEARAESSGTGAAVGRGRLGTVAPRPPVGSRAGPIVDASLSDPDDGFEGTGNGHGDWTSAITPEQGRTER